MLAKRCCDYLFSLTWEVRSKSSSTSSIHVVEDMTSPVSRLFFQLNRFAVVGIVSNIVLFGLYLALTSFGIEHKLAITFVYIVGVVQTFFFNRQWTFNKTGEADFALLRYIIVYVLGYFISISLLFIFVDRLDFPHQFVMGVTIVLVAGCMFVLQKYWVFKS